MVSHPENDFSKHRAPVYWRRIFLDGELGWRWKCMDKQDTVIAKSIATISDYVNLLA
jgi:hypothetical protein